MHLQQTGDALATDAAPADTPDQRPLKLTVRFTGEALKTVRALANKRGISINEFMRRAVSTELFILEQIANGATILMEDRRGRVTQLVFPS